MEKKLSGDETIIGEKARFCASKAHSSGVAQGLLKTLRPGENQEINMNRTTTMKNDSVTSRNCGSLNLEPAESCSTLLRMYYDFRGQSADVHPGTNGAILSTAVAYEDFPAGMHALRTFQGLFDENQKTFEFNMRNIWKFDFLRIPELRESAVTETVRADLIIISMHTPRELPAGVKWWIEAALEQREQDPGALVLMYNKHPAGGAALSPAETYLTQRARKAGLDFFVKRPGIPQEMTQPVPTLDRGQITGFPGPAVDRETGLVFNHRRFGETGWN